MGLIKTQALNEPQILTVRLLRRKHMHVDLCSVELATRVSDSQLEHVHPGQEVCHHHLVIQLGFLRDSGLQSNIRISNHTAKYN